MANVSRINGLNPVKYLNGTAYNGQANTYFIPSGNAVNTFVGDPVKADTTGDTVAAGGLAMGVQSVVQAAAGDPLLGVIVGFAVAPTNLNTPQFRTASTGRYVLVADDPNILFEGEVSGTTLTAADVGLNTNVIVGAGSTTTGNSAVSVSGTAAATTATLQLRIMGFTQRVDNEVGNAAAKVLVRINNHQMAAGTGVAGV
jgi:hypothetical protein